MLPVLVWDNGDAASAGSPEPCSSFSNSVASFKDLFLIEFFSFLCLTVLLLFLVLSQGSAVNNILGWFYKILFSCYICVLLFPFSICLCSN